MESTLRGWAAGAIAVTSLIATLVDRSAALAQDHSRRPPNVHHVRFSPQSTQASPGDSTLSRPSPDNLPLPREPGRILGLPIEPGGPGAIETLPMEESLSLADLEGMALGNNPTLVQANARIDAARGQWTQAGLLPNPSVGWAATQIGDRGTAGQQGPYFAQVVPLGGKLRLSRAVADRQVQQAIWQREAQQWAVLNDVRIGFYDVLIAQRTIDVASRLVEIGDQGERAADDLVKAEQVSRVDFLQARIEARTARIELRNARNRHDAAWRRLTAVVGVPGLPACALAGDAEQDLPCFTWDEALGRLLAASPELAAARAGVQRASFAVERARVEPIPNIEGQYSPQHDFAAADNIHNVQATLNIPLFNRNQGNIRTAQADFISATRDVARIEFSLQERLATTFERYANARQQVETYKREILPDAKASLDLVSNGYREGEFSYLTLLTAQRTFFQTSLAYLSSLLELRRSSVEIEGYLLTGSLGQSGAADEARPQTSQSSGVQPWGEIR